eukprot:scaffold25804_cov58-Attheya_sp.AAC.3
MHADNRVISKYIRPHPTATPESVRVVITAIASYTIRMQVLCAISTESNVTNATGDDRSPLLLSAEDTVPIRESDGKTRTHTN